MNLWEIFIQWWRSVVSKGTNMWNSLKFTFVGKVIYFGSWKRSECCLSWPFSTLSRYRPLLWYPRTKLIQSFQCDECQLNRDELKAGFLVKCVWWEFRNSFQMPLFLVKAYQSGDVTMVICRSVAFQSSSHNPKPMFVASVDILFNLVLTTGTQFF